MQLFLLFYLTLDGRLVVLLRVALRGYSLTGRAGERGRGYLPRAPRYNRGPGGPISRGTPPPSSYFPGLWGPQMICYPGPHYGSHRPCLLVHLLWIEEYIAGVENSLIILGTYFRKRSMSYTLLHPLVISCSFIQDIILKHKIGDVGFV